MATSVSAIEAFSPRGLTSRGRVKRKSDGRYLDQTIRLMIINLSLTFVGIGFRRNRDVRNRDVRYFILDINLHPKSPSHVRGL